MSTHSPSLFSMLSGMADPTLQTPARMVRVGTGTVPVSDLELIKAKHLPLVIKVGEFENQRSITAGRTYISHHYQVVETQHGVKHLEATVEDDENLPFTFRFERTLGDTPPPYEVDLVDMERKVTRLKAEKLIAKCDRVQAMVDAYQRPSTALTAGTFVRWRDNLQSVGFVKGLVGIIVDPPVRVDFRALSAHRLLHGGVVENYDCVVAAPDNDGDLIFCVVDSARLEVVTRPTLDKDVP